MLVSVSGLGHAVCLNTVKWGKEAQSGVKKRKVAQRSVK